VVFHDLDADGAGDLLPFAGDGGYAVVQLLEHPLYIHQKLLAFGVEEEFAVAPFKELGVEFFLQSCDGLGHRGLGDGKVSGRFGDIFQFCYFLKITKLQ
jgi:hypothetical protein